MSENKFDVINNIEGPRPKFSVDVSIDEYRREGRRILQNGKDPRSWIMREIEKKLPSSSIKDIVSLACREGEAEELAGFPIGAGPIQISEAGAFAFRGVRRNSHSKPSLLRRLIFREKDPLDIVDDNLFYYGIENPDVNHQYISSGSVYTNATFPTITELDREESIQADTSVIMIYHRRPFIHESKTGNKSELKLVDLTIPTFANYSDRATTISPELARKKHYPTLRDIFLGQIEVAFK